MNRQNPATRLLNILKDASHRSHSEDVLNVWARVFNAPEGSQSMFNRFCWLKRLIKEVRTLATEKLGDEADIYLSGFDSIDSMVRGYNFHDSWGSKILYFNEQALHSLDTLAFALDDVQLEEEPLDLEELDEFHDKLDEVLALIKARSVDQVFRQILVETLTRIQEALGDYPVRGAEGFRECITSFLGRYWLKRDAFADQLESGEFIEVAFLLFWTARLADVAFHTEDYSQALQSLMPEIPGISC